MADNGIGYSLGNTNKKVFQLPKNSQANHKAKQAVDSVFVRSGDGLRANTVFVGERMALIFAALPSIVSSWLVLGCYCGTDPFETEGQSAGDTGCGFI